MSNASRTSRSRRELVADILGRLSPAQERRALLDLMAAEQLAAGVYDLAAAAAPVSPAGQELARRLGGQERAHAAELARVTGQPAGGRTAAGRTAAGRTAAGPGGIEKALSAHGITVRFS